MYLIVGLGNPENQYAKTRHNMGFDVINEISKRYKIDVTKEKFNGLYGTGEIEDKKVILLKPQTYMNLSGQALVKFADYYKIEKENIIVVFDDKDIEEGTIRVRKQGGPGTHNGMKSVVQELKTEDFARVRIGIGSEDEIFDMVGFVINRLSDEKYEKLKPGIEKGAEAVISILKDGIDIAMNKFN